MKSSSLRFWFRSLAVIVGCAWIGWLLTIQAAELIEAKWGETIVETVKLRTYDASHFVRCRIFEVAWLTTLLSGILAAFLLLVATVGSRLSKLWSMLLLSVIAFVAANGFTWAAMQTGTFWLGLQALGPDYRLPCAAAEWQMLKESKTRQKGIVMGSSQAPAQIDVKILNERLGPDVQFGNLSYVGSECVDLLMLQNYLHLNPDVVVCYLSEMSFFRGVTDDHVLTLMTRQSAKDIRELKGGNYLPPLSKRYGALSCAMPLFRARRGIEAALFGVTGTPAVSFTKSEQRSELERKEGRERFIRSFHRDETVDFQKAALRQLVRNFQQHGTRVLLIAGSVHESISASLDPAYRAEMLQFLTELGLEYSHVLVVAEGQQLPRATPDQYRDWTHLAEEYRPWYSQAVIEMLSDKFGWRYHPSGCRKF